MKQVILIILISSLLVGCGGVYGTGHYPLDCAQTNITFNDDSCPPCGSNGMINTTYCDEQGRILK